MIRIRRKQLDRQTPFNFTCKRCLQCCHSKKIQINPYEVARLARNRGLSTTEFIRRYTVGGTHLKFNNDDACPFLEKHGCGVHEDRPLVCRLYPLGRHVFENGDEHFSEVEPDPGCKGKYSKDAAIQNYLEEQGALPFIEAADMYLTLLWKLLSRLQDETIDAEKQNEILGAVRDFSNSESEQGNELTDMDAALAQFGKEIGRPVPEDLQLKMFLHVQMIENLMLKP